MNPTDNTLSGLHWNICNVCKKPILYNGVYYKCSVSTCNRTRFQLYFCSVECWDAHVPGQRHKSSYATEQRAPKKNSAI